MQNLYDILGVPRDAANKEINAALRHLVRRYNEETAEGTRDLTEALKFVNYARLTFVDPQRRTKYDAELDLFEAEQAIVAARQASTLAEQTRVVEPADNSARHEQKSSPPAVVQAAEPESQQQPPVSTLGPPSDFQPSDFQSSDFQPSSLSAVDPILMSVPLETGSSRISFATNPALAANTGYDLGPVLNSRAGTKKRSTAPYPVSRLAARLIDYGMWGLILALLVHLLSSVGILSSSVAQTLAHPVVAPIVITLTWAFVEAVLLIFFPFTPGKFLLNIHVGLNVSNPYAGIDPGAHMAASFARAFQVWWRGVAGGVSPIYFFTLARAYRKLRSVKETSWDFDNDCLVTHGKVAPLNALAAAALLIGGSWLYTSQWAMPLEQTVNISWRSAEAGFVAGREMAKTLSGNLPTYAKKKTPPLPAQENRTAVLEKEAQQLIDQREWRNLSEHCLAWKQEEERNAAAWSCYGRARHELADYGTAITALKRAMLLAPQDDDIRRLLKNASLVDMEQKQMRKRRDSDQNRQSGSVGG